MGESQHTSDLRNVKEGDGVTFTTSDGETYNATCTNYDEQHADERSGEVRTTSIWTLDIDGLGGRADVAIVDGLKSSPEQDDFPRYHEIWQGKDKPTLGYIEKVQIHG